MKLKNFNKKLGLDTLLFKMYINKIRLLTVMFLKIKKFGGILFYSEEFVF